MIHTLGNKTSMEHTKELVKRERHLCAKLIAYLAETDHRRLFPQIITLLESGALHLTGANLLSPHLTDDNFTKLIDL